MSVMKKKKTKKGEKHEEEAFMRVLSVVSDIEVPPSPTRSNMSQSHTGIPSLEH